MLTPFSRGAPDIEVALSDLRAAESVYREAPPEASDEAWLILQAARQRLNRLIREAREAMAS